MFSEVEAAIKNYETAFQMQTAVPEACDLGDESEATKQLYGLDSSDANLAAFGRQCIVARRLVERGVRFIELSSMPTERTRRKRSIRGISITIFDKTMPSTLIKSINRSPVYCMT